MRQSFLFKLLFTTVYSHLIFLSPTLLDSSLDVFIDTAFKATGRRVLVGEQESRPEFHELATRVPQE